MRVNNGTHPADAGYYKFADSIYCWLKALTPLAANTNQPKKSALELTTPLTLTIKSPLCAGRASLCSAATIQLFRPLFELSESGFQLQIASI